MPGPGCLGACLYLHPVTTTELRNTFDLDDPDEHEDAEHSLRDIQACLLNHCYQSYSGSADPRDMEESLRCISGFLGDRPLKRTLGVPAPLASVAQQAPLPSGPRKYRNIYCDPNAQPPDSINIARIKENYGHCCGMTNHPISTAELREHENDVAEFIQSILHCLENCKIFNSNPEAVIQTLHRAEWVLGGPPSRTSERPRRREGGGHMRSGRCGRFAPE